MNYPGDGRMMEASTNASRITALEVANTTSKYGEMRHPKGALYIYFFFARVGMICPSPLLICVIAAYDWTI